MKSKRNKYPSVDIIVLNFNRCDDTLQCLESLVELDYPNFRVTLTDNGSTDGTVSAVRMKYPKVNIIALKENLRFAGGNNTAMKRALKEGFDYVLLLNNDTIADDDFLKYMVQAAELSPKIGMVCPKIYYHVPPDVIWFAGGKINLNFAYARHIGIGKKDSGQFNSAGITGWLSGACLLIKREVIDKVGFLDDGFFLYSEDMDYSLRVRKAGYELYYQPKAFIWHKVSRSTPTLRKHLLRLKAWQRVINKHSPKYLRPLQWSFLALELIPLALGFILRRLRFLRKGI
ncbi:glycosyltransferase family 2 protein [bacterium]|nr:glycosyltransferase family 2 protein [bacterium]